MSAPVTVTVTFAYVPDEPDASDSTGMSADEYERLSAALIDLGADDLQIEVQR